MTRDALIDTFLAANGYALRDARPLAQDASFRRYLRLDGGAVLMDAPPPEDIRPFLRIAAHLEAIGLSVPRIAAADPANGLILEEDLGDSLFGAIMTEDTAEKLLEAAIDALVILQRAAPPPGMPSWGKPEMMDTALGTLFDWWWPAMHGGPPPDAARAEVADALAAVLTVVETGPRCLVHRDFFAGNLLWLDRRAGHRRTGVIDFQGCAIGHPAYDLVSLLQDARRDIPAHWADRALRRYLAARPEIDPIAFRAAYAACAAQRHLRVSCQWVRLARRDGRPQYLEHGPRTWRLLNAALTNPAVAKLAAALDRWVPPAQRRNPPEPDGGWAAPPDRTAAPCPAGVTPNRNPSHPANIHSAMILAAGLATRMRPLTGDTAKPLLMLRGRTLLDHALDRLAVEGVDTVAVNAFWQADKVVAHLAARRKPPIVAPIRETALLDTGGGVRNALPVLGSDPFYVINGDAFWLNGPRTALSRLARALTDEVDVVLLVHRTYQVRAETGAGDFAVSQLGVPRRRHEGEIVPYIFAGASLMRPSLLDDTPDGGFSLNLVWTRAMAAGRIRAVVHDGLWFHLSTPPDLAAAERALAANPRGDSGSPWH